jgi:hypothetical protein
MAKRAASPVMDLRDFISVTLADIVGGVADAQKSCPGVTLEHNRWVDFEVAITAVEKENGKAGIGVFGAGISLGVEAGISDANTSVSNVKFRVALVGRGQ